MRSQMDEIERYRMIEEARSFRLTPRPEEEYESRIVIRLVTPAEGHSVYESFHGSKVLEQKCAK